jgi:hypothetical protein
MLVAAVALTVWLGYNLLVERVSETRDGNPLSTVAVTAALYFLGYNWLRGNIPNAK